MRLSRRSLLRSAAGLALATQAPRQAKALWPRGARATGTDLFAEQLALYSPGEWTPNLITAVGGTSYLDMPGFIGPSNPDYFSYYAHGSTLPGGLNNLPWAYSSGVFLPDKNKYAYTGGGHADWLGSQIGSFDFPSLSWTQTDDSSQVDIVADLGAPFQPTDNGYVYAGPDVAATLTASIGPTDTTIPTSSGPSFPSSGTFAVTIQDTPSEYVLCSGVSGNNLIVAAGGRGYAGTTAASHASGIYCTTAVFPWPNKEGRRTPISNHMYGGMAYMKELGLIQVMGGASYPSGHGQPGGAQCIDATTGQWTETDVCPFVGYAAPCSQWIPDCKVVGGGTAGRTFWMLNGSSLKLCDPTTNTWETAGNQFDVVAAYYCRGTMIPDPINAGYRAWLTVPLTDLPAQGLLCQQIDVTGPNPNHAMIYYPWANTGPTPGGTDAGTWGSAMLYMGYDRPGSKQVVFFDPSSPAQLYLLDTSTMGASSGGTWSGPVSLTGTPPNTECESGAGHANGTWKRFFYHPAYDAFCFFCGPSGVSGTDNQTDVGFYAFKRPSAVT